ncbi:MAG TPA: EAL domain-containing protein [Caulobacteraceae bacterium]|jgi:diguanylate cyclase (GGDEF)-like protein
MNKKDLKADFFWPLVVLAVFALALLVAMAFLLVDQFDVAARVREQAVIENGLAERTAEIGQMVAPQVEWDEAIRRLDNRYDPTWARDNIGSYLSHIDGFDETFVLDRDDRPLFASDRALPVDPKRYAALESQSRSIVAAVRRAEARRGPPRASARMGGVFPSPIQASTIAAQDGMLYILTASLVQPDMGEAEPLGPRSPIVLTRMVIDRPFLDAFAQRFLLQNLHLRQGAGRRPGAEARVAIHNDRGQEIASLAWTPQDPGRALLQHLVTPVLVVVFLLVLLALLFYRRSVGVARHMIASEARAAHLAYYDALTGLPNRVLLFDRLGHALDQMRRGHHRVAVHCIDLDRFKEVNDTFGHHVGDQLIQEAARRMAAQCRASDTFARLSGDEFAVVQTHATARSAAALADRLAKTMAQPIKLGSVRVYVGCSIGVSLLPEGDIEPAEALRQADLALYRAKQTSKGQFCFYEIEMDAAMKTRRALEGDLRDALARGEVRMVYQPQVNGHGVMIGVEALARWRHPERGEIPPAYFVPIAEECGLIVDLGMFTLRRAFEDARRWGQLKVTVNLSATQLRMRDFAQKVAELAEELSVDPRQFELDITEGFLLGDDLDTQDMLKQLRDMGFALALDDFGAGFSSLSYLKRHPINRIKIDRSFIADLGVDTEADAVVTAIVQLARALKLSVIAEGVETVEQLERLAGAGCSEVQGFLFSRPVDASEIDRLYGSRLVALVHQTA